MNGAVKYRLSEILDERGLNQREFAKMANLNEGTISSICRNHYDRLGKTTIAKICRTLNIEPGDWIIIDSES